jgi:potassium-dependent mechanosensitive channel
MIQQTRYTFKFRWISFLFLLVMASTVQAATKSNSETSLRTFRNERAELLSSIEQAFISETSTVEDIKNRLARLEIFQQAVLIEVNAYSVQNAAHTNLLLNSATPIPDLEKGIEENRLSIAAIEDKLKDLAKRRDSVQELRQQTKNQLQLNENQLAEVKSSPWSASEKAALLKALDRLAQILAEKDRLLQNLHEGLGKMINQLETVKATTKQLSENFFQQLKRRTTRELFEKKHTLLKIFSKAALFNEISFLTKNIHKLFTTSFWTDEYHRIKDAGAMVLMLLVVVLIVAFIVGNRLRLLCLQHEKQISDPALRWRTLCVKLIRRSILLFTMFTVFYAYSVFQFYHYRIAFFRLISNVLLILLLTRWALDFLKLWEPKNTFQYFRKTIPLLRGLLTSLRYLTVGYVIVQWAIGKDSILLCVERLAIEIGLIVCCFSFWQTFWQAKNDQYQNQNTPKSRPLTTLMLFIYFIVVSGVIIEFAGYPTLAVYWMVSWANSLAALFWAILLFNIIREWQINVRHLPVTTETESRINVQPIQRLFVHLCWLLWFGFVWLSILLAWSSKPGFFTDVYAIFNRPFAIGKINLSLMGLFFSALILFFTHVFTRVGAYILETKVFVGSDTEPGLQDSISTISIYLLWGLGVVMALSVLGVSTTSLAVVFGALSIGIGFGLQNIFNNFISGIILLLERPIQVGDAIEIGGIWAEVKKINIRATLVQTFDNASLIIPNSEFISSQVTNWSFKEPSLRRKVNVGVAYGSDVELVRKTLLEIADQTAHVMQKPKPDVIFYDHGDSALIFTLRYWTTIKYYYTTSTDIRFAIDRLFKERNIEIAFPQRDIHIRSRPKDQEAVNASTPDKNTPDIR